MWGGEFPRRGSGRMGRESYYRVRAFIHEITGGDPAKVALKAGALALWSPRLTLESALNLMIAANIRWNAGLPAALVHTRVQAARYDESRREQRLPRLARKAADYAWALARGPGGD